MKSKIYVLVFLICLGGAFFGGATKASAHSVTDVGIEFDEATKESIEPPSKVDSIKPIKPMGRLPSTGELITSAIWMLLGTSVLIFFVGIISLKTVMSNKLWERVC